MITSTQITKAEIFTFIAVLVFKLLSRRVMFVNKKDNNSIPLNLRSHLFTNLQNYLQNYYGQIKSHLKFRAGEHINMSSLT